MPRSYLCTELNQNHVLVRGGVPYDLHMLHDIVKWCHELHEVMAGHGRWDSQDAHHRTASDILSQWRHFAATRQKTATKTHTLKQRITSEAVNKHVRWDSLGLVEVHDAMDDLHWGVPTEERDLVRQLFGGGVRSSARRLAAVLWTLSVLQTVCCSLRFTALFCWTSGFFTSSFI